MIWHFHPSIRRSLRRHVLLLSSTWSLDREKVQISSMKEMSNQSFSLSESLLDDSISTSKWYRTNSVVPRSSCSCKNPDFQHNLVQDEWRLSSESTQTVPRSIRWSSMLRYQLVVRFLRDSTFSADSWRLSQCTDNRRSANCGGVTSTFRIGYPPLARSVSWRGLSFGDSSLRPGFLVLEDWVQSCFSLLRIHCWVWVDVSRQFPVAGWNTTLIQFLSPQGCLDHSKSCGGSFFALVRFLDTKFTGLGFATADPSFGVLSWALLDMALRFLFERGWLQKKHWEIHDIQQMKKMDPLTMREAFFG